MNNYTLVLKTQQPGVTPDQVKAAVEDTLLRAIPPVTLRFGDAAQPDPGTILFAVASDGKRDFIARTLSGLENRLPVRVERIDWGNQVVKNAQGSVDSSNMVLKLLRTDPFADTAPQSEPVHVYRPSIWSNIRGSIATLSWLAWAIFLAIYISIPVSTHKPPLAETPLLAFFVQGWMLLSILVGPPYTPWRMITQVTCDVEGITVWYLFNRATRRVYWSAIHGLADNTLDLTLFSDQKPIRFSAKQRAGFKEERMLIKTIITRAELYYVGVAFPGYIYKRTDAPD